MKKYKSFIVLASALLMTATTGIAYAATQPAETTHSPVQATDAEISIPFIIPPDGKEQLDENLNGEWGKELKRQGVDIDNPEFRDTYIEAKGKDN